MGTPSSRSHSAYLESALPPGPGQGIIGTETYLETPKLVVVSVSAPPAAALLTRQACLVESVSRGQPTTESLTMRTKPFYRPSRRAALRRDRSLHVLGWIRNVPCGRRGSKPRARFGACKATSLPPGHTRRGSWPKLGTHSEHGAYVLDTRSGRCGRSRTTVSPSCSGVSRSSPCRVGQRAATHRFISFRGGFAPLTHPTGICATRRESESGDL